MSGGLIIFVGLIYLGIAGMQAWKGNTAMAMVYAGYSFSNVGLFMAAR